MKTLSTALSSKLIQGKPRKYCKRCGKELRPTELCRPNAKHQEPSTMKQRTPTTDEKEHMETSQDIVIREHHVFFYYINSNTTEFHSFFKQQSPWADPTMS